jgi:hypothetical protein
MANTSLGFPQPSIGSNNWGNPTNAGWMLLDQFLNGTRAIGGLNVSGNVTISGSLTAGYIAGVIPAGLVLIPFSATPVINATQGLQFKIVLTGNVTSSTFINGASGPTIIVVRIVQDGVGGHTFAWPSNMLNAGTPNTDANSTSVQMFAVNTDGSATAVGPMMYS